MFSESTRTTVDEAFLGHFGWQRALLWASRGTDTNLGHTIEETGCLTSMRLGVTGTNLVLVCH